eukprot:477723-Prorocentrum_minimum.AAC.2
MHSYVYERVSKNDRMICLLSLSESQARMRSASHYGCRESTHSGESLTLMITNVRVRIVLVDTVPISCVDA